MIPFSLSAKPSSSPSLKTYEKDPSATKSSISINNFDSLHNLNHFNQHLQLFFYKSSSPSFCKIHDHNHLHHASASYTIIIFTLLHLVISSPSSNNLQPPQSSINFTIEVLKLHHQHFNLHYLHCSTSICDFNNILIPYSFALFNNATTTTIKRCNREVEEEARRVQNQELSGVCIPEQEIEDR